MLPTLNPQPPTQPKPLGRRHLRSTGRRGSGLQNMVHQHYLLRSAKQTARSTHTHMPPPAKKVFYPPPHNIQIPSLIGLLQTAHWSAVARQLYLVHAQANGEAGATHLPDQSPASFTSPDLALSVCSATPLWKTYVRPVQQTHSFHCTVSLGENEVQIKCCQCPIN